MNKIEKVNKIIEPLAEDLKKLALDIYNNPELGNEEYKACKWQVELLEKYGFKVEKEFCNIPTAYKAVYKSKKPGTVIAMLSEYDALPEIGHACGHNLIALVGVGAGIGLRDIVDEYGGEVQVIGTPAEETAGAKVKMANDDAFKDVDIAMMAHPSFVNAESMNTIAINCFKFEFFGAPSHASSAPEEGINALDAVINFFNLINALRQQTKDDARIHGIITNGGVAPNIIPDRAEALFYIRANESEYLEELCQKVKACANGAALGTGTRVEISDSQENFKNTRSNMVLSDLFCEQVEMLGSNVTKFGGRPFPGSSDFGDVSHICPAIQTAFKIGNPISGNIFEAHTEDFLKCAGSDEGISSGLLYAKAFIMTGIEILTNPDHLKAIRKEFNK